LLLVVLHARNNSVSELMIRNVLSVGGLTLVSRVSGFVRDVLTAALLGAGPAADAFFIALRLPNHFRALFAEGAFAAAFVPLFSGKLAADGAQAAKDFAADAQSLLLSAQLILLAAALLFMPQFMWVFAPGFADEPERFELAVLFTRITFPYLAFISLETLYAGVLNAGGRFAAAAAAPVLMNLSMITALLAATPFLPTAGHALAWGVLISGALQYALVAGDAARHGWFLPLRLPRLTPDVRRFLILLGPAALGAGLTQINLFADTLIASLLPAGSVSYLYYADRLNQLPLGVIGVAVATVLLPELSRRIKGGDEAGAVTQQNRAMEISLLAALPAAVAFVLIGDSIMTALFRYGRFSVFDAAASAATLAAYAAGLPAFILLRSLVVGFYAREDTKTPVRAALAATVVNVTLKFALMEPLAQVGLAVATSAAAWVNVAVLTWALHRRGGFVPDARLKRTLPRLVLAAALMAPALYYLEILLAPWLTGDADALMRVAALIALCAGGGAVYAGAGLALGVADRDLLRKLRRRKSGDKGGGC
jgi:putative peptidoglycan lipid II flippase